MPDTCPEPAGIRAGTLLLDKVLLGNFEFFQHLVKLSFEQDVRCACGTLVYSGYVDDPRNTDDAWME